MMAPNAEIELIMGKQNTFTELENNGRWMIGH